MELSEHEQVILLILSYNYYFSKNPNRYYILTNEFKKFKLVLPKNIVEGSLAYLEGGNYIEGRKRLADTWLNSPVKITPQGINRFRLVNRQDLKESNLVSGNARLENILTKVAFNKMNISKRVFIVHGHKEKPKLMLRDFLHGLGLKPIILHEQPNMGRTIIQKFKQNAISVGYAFVLLTPDDVGRPKHERNLKPRARQNVIFELGFFLGSLKCGRVCCIHTKDVEIPSDYQGVIYLTYQQSIKHCFRAITRELQAAGYDVTL